MITKYIIVYSRGELGGLLLPGLSQQYLLLYVQALNKSYLLPLGLAFENGRRSRQHFALKW